MSENPELRQDSPVETGEHPEATIPLLNNLGNISLRTAFAGVEGLSAQDNQEDVDRLTARLTTTEGSEGS
jgi:hypothetical protein